MDICQNCGSFVDEGEPFCLNCFYIFPSCCFSVSKNDCIDIDEYGLDELEEALE